MIDESRDAPQLEAALLFENEMMRIETYSRQTDLSTPLYNQSGEVESRLIEDIFQKSLSQ